MTKPPTRILIVGGVAGGASAATRARRADEHASIVMLEKDGDVSFANCGLPYHLGGTIRDRRSLLVATPERFRDRFRIDVRTRHEAIAIDRSARTVRVRDHQQGRDYDEPFDKLILAPGAAPIVPDVPGVRSSGVFTLRNLDDMDRILAALAGRTRVAVVGAGFIGLEVAEQLRERGLAVTLVEKADQVLPLLDPELAEPLRRELLAHGVEVIVGTGFTAIAAADGRATGVVLADGRTIAADLVVLGLGVRASSQLASAAGLDVGPGGGIRTDACQRTSDPDIYAVGDAAEYALGTGGRGRVPLAGIANRTGRLAGEHAVRGQSAPFPRAFGTAIVKVFGLAAAITGDSLRAARRRGLDARSVHVLANHHAGYYPGAAPLLLQLVYEAGSGRMLGAQAVGKEGVDKRIDVVATLLHYGGTVADLAQLDLAYAPPFGSAKDALHMAAFAAGNDLDGSAPLLHPATDLTGWQVVDVRAPDERARLPLPGVQDARAIPIDELRQRLHELDSSARTAVVCHTGVRAHVGTRLLRQHGFAAHTLSGSTHVRELALHRPDACPAVGGPSTPASPGPGGATAACGTVAACGAPIASPGIAGDELAAVDVAAAPSAGALLLDVRSPGEYRSGHLRSAVNLPLERVQPDAVRSLLQQAGCTKVWLLCASGSRARAAAGRLGPAGLDCTVVRGGTQACREAGLPIEGTAGAMSLERQVRIAAGALVLLSILGALWLHTGALGLAAFVGTGLMFAGLTDWCGMGLLLARAPWNR